MDVESETNRVDFQAEQPRPPRKVWLWVVGGLALLVLLGGAAFVAGRLINQRNNPAGGEGGLTLSSNGPGGPVMKKFDLQNAKELPDRKPDTSGLFVRRQDNSLFVGTGKITVGVTKGGGNASGSGMETSANYDGPVVEVVVTKDTLVYKDTTQFNPGQVSGEEKIQQTVASGSLDEIGSDSMISVWGRKSGDRMIAEVLVYSSPVIMAKPGR